MAEYFRIDPKLKDKLLNPFFTPPEFAKAVKGGEPGVDGVWEEPVLIENYEFTKEDPSDRMSDERVRVQYRVTGDTQSGNQGRMTSEFMNFPVKAFTEGRDEGKVTQFTMSYNRLMTLWDAIGGQGHPDAGEIQPDEVIGRRVMALIRVAKDKQGTRRQSVLQFLADGQA